MEEWISYVDHSPPDDLIDEVIIIRVKSVVDGHIYEQYAKWTGNCFMEEDEPESLVGPIRVVTHWKKL